ncbi:NAD(P)-dependent oxidoreductase [Nocardia sp. CA2R105]|uniref:NAD-dependent epimerase/dehydratase family protein n=1 Tax=Nocardia coffeae TaxID=2873381 RepID=UPI001CA63DB6|nr:NAD(P)-dependent oxidoreductase [Nocardia coffeae]MBY8858691.1 NAD(P)-dependent oxidoreductase [Nocardia coffeae]
MAVLVTGVGYIGGYAVRDLLFAGEKVVLFGYLGGQGDPHGELPEIDYIDHLTGGGLTDGRYRDQVEVVVGDVSDLRGMSDAAERHEARSVLHFATMLSAGAQANPLISTHVNVIGTTNVFEVAARMQMDKVVWASSVDVFGPRSVPESGVLTDDCMYDPVWLYGASKVMSEKLAFAYSDKHGIDITGLRPTRVYGYGEYIKAGRGGGSSWLGNLLYAPAVGDTAVTVPFGSRSLDFVYVEDIADGFVKALGFRGDKAANNYILSGDRQPIPKAVEYVRRLLPDARIELEMEDLVLPPGSGFAFSRQYDSNRATTDFGFHSRFSMEAGVYRTINLNRRRAGLPEIPQPEDAKVGI